MSDAASTSLQRVVSDRHFLGRSLVTTTVAAVISAVALIAIVLCSGGIVELLSRNAQGSDVGLLQADPETAATTIQRIVDAIPLLHSRMSALTTLIFAIVVLLFLRTALRAFAQEKVNRQVSKGVNRLREHIQRHALR